MSVPRGTGSVFLEISKYDRTTMCNAHEKDETSSILKNAFYAKNAGVLFLISYLSMPYLWQSPKKEGNRGERPGLNKKN